MAGKTTHHKYNMYKNQEWKGGYINVGFQNTISRENEKWVSSSRNTSQSSTCMHLNNLINK